MLQFPFITENHEVICSIHNKRIESISYLYKDKIEIYCSDCQSTKFSGRNQATLKGYADLQILVVTLTPQPHMFSLEKSDVNQYTDFSNNQVKYLILDNHSEGYCQRSLAYIQDQNILLVCGKNGRIVLWSLGENKEDSYPEYVSHFEIPGKKIDQVKYLNISNDCKYVALVLQTEIYIYGLKESKLTQLKILNCQSQMNDIEYVSTVQKIVTGGESQFLQIWNLETFQLERKLDLNQLQIEYPISNIIDMKTPGLIALEHSKGILITNLEEVEETEHYWVDYKETKGSLYLPQSERFLIYITKKEVHLIDANDFILHTKFLVNLQEDQVQFFLNDNESQVICTTTNSPPTLFGNKQTNLIRIDHTLQKDQFSAILAFDDRQQFAAASEKKGIIGILQTNSYSKWFKPGKWVQGLGKKPPQAKNKSSQRAELTHKKVESQKEKKDLMILEAESKSDETENLKQNARKSQSQTRGRKKNNETKDKDERSRSRSKSKSPIREKVRSERRTQEQRKKEDNSSGRHE